jgi:hypothetical protein
MFDFDYFSGGFPLSNCLFETVEKIEALLLWNIEKSALTLWN